MRRQFQLLNVGQEVQKSDIESIAESAALSEDRVFGELMRLPPGASSKGVLLEGNHDLVGGLQVLPVVKSSGLADASIHIPQLRAIAGSATADRSTVRSAIAGLNSGTDLQFTATAANNRWDLVYCRVDIEPYESPVSRYVKAADGTQSVQSVAVFRNTTAVFGILAGTEGATPTRPAVPADGGGIYYIPLAYVSHTHPFTLTSTVLPGEIDESVCPVSGVAPQVGGSDVRPAGAVNNIYLPVMAAWTVGAGRPREYMPPVMNGKVERFFALDFTGGHESLALGASSLIDDTIDWRNRYFKTTVSVGSGDIAHTIATAAPFPTGANATLNFTFMGQSFVIDTYGTVTAGQQGHVAILNSATVSIAASSNIELYVASTGGLYAKCAATTPASLIFIWIEATGKFVNV